MSTCVTRASLGPTSRTTSCARGGARCWPSWPTGCAASPTTSTSILPFDEVIAALGYEGERVARACKTIKLVNIVGTVDYAARLRSPLPADLGAGAGALGAAGPRAAPGRADAAHRRLQGGRPVLRQGRPPSGVDRAGDRADHDRRLRHRGAHHAAGQGHPHPAAICCSRATSGCSWSRVPLPPQMRAKITVSDPWSYAKLGENVEAWGFRYCSTSSGSATGPRSPGAGSPTSTRRW